MAFPADGPNNSIKGVAPVNNKEQQFDMVFGISEEDPLYTTKVQQSGSPPSNGNSRMASPRQHNNTSLARSGSIGAPRFQNGKSPYSNGVVVKRASVSTSTLLDQELRPRPNVVSFDVNVKAAPVHGDTTLGLGSSTFLDGAPAYGTATKKIDSELSRKKSNSGLLKRVKSLKVSRK
ncbi:unnamed protein product [Ambrosiozyma monospora]|uniref:Unnamed protein product n=1 Tax=Ambrosiozyma monospora TaxID=43982 RepID=A0ACB5T168_AMBMO|nr:unnamed protein product [Ambrosiozyma monospora]